MGLGPRDVQFEKLVETVFRKGEGERDPASCFLQPPLLLWSGRRA